ncbi:hypothetical protein BCR43DRAFT_2319 [Syncephalastrum racemosum]|uniref:Uncharacterized protein n=1 Tax=Syncephalastrum racemosum TaxID=13706 RepID=A0A1X2HRI8_SYNRA|nr:hypothetical protein BCR43DRAFT_2319 [Syncephalastrum racemosum]
MTMRDTDDREALLLVERMCARSLEHAYTGGCIPRSYYAGQVHKTMILSKSGMQRVSVMHEVCSTQFCIIKYRSFFPLLLLGILYIALII